MASTTPSIVRVSIYSDASEFPTEKRYDSSIKISELKEKLELITGANHNSMKISLFLDETEIAQLSNNDETLAFYLGQHVGSETTFKLVVKDEQPSLLLEAGDAPKFVISEDKYLQRPNNAREFIKEMREKRMSGQSSGAQ